MDTLPEELIYQILYLSEYQEIAALFLLNRQFSELINQKIFWRNKIEMWRPGSEKLLMGKEISPLVELGKILSSASGEMYIFGSNYYGQLGMIDLFPSYVPQKLENFSNTKKIGQISSGKNHTALITINGQVYTLGSNMAGQLGLGDFDSRYLPLLVPQLTNAIQLSCGGAHTAVVTITGELYTFGSNNRGQLGFTDTGNNCPYPQRLPFPTDVIQVSCGMFHTALVTNSGQIYTFGANKSGQLGLGDITDRDVPTPLEQFPEKARQVICGKYHTVVVTTKGNLYTWGNNNFGQLGIGLDKMYITIPCQIRDIPKVKQVSAGTYHTAFITNKGELYTCGDNRSGQLGILGTTGTDIPLKITFPEGITDVSCGENHTVCITEDGQLYSFGSNHRGQLGLADGECKLIPTPIPGLFPASKISCGTSYTAVLCSDR